MKKRERGRKQKKPFCCPTRALVLHLKRYCLASFSFFQWLSLNYTLGTTTTPSSIEITPSFQRYFLPHFHQLSSLSTLSTLYYLKLYHRVIAGIRHLHTACRKSNLQTLSRPSPPLIPSISSFPSTLPALPLAHLHTLSNYYLAPPFTTLTDHDI